MRAYVRQSVAIRVYMQACSSAASGEGAKSKGATFAVAIDIGRTHHATLRCATVLNPRNRAFSWIKHHNSSNCTCPSKAACFVSKIKSLAHSAQRYAAEVSVRFAARYQKLKLQVNGSSTSE